MPFLNNQMEISLNLDNLIKKPFLTPDELAKFLNISRSSIYRLIENRMIAFYKIGGSLRFRKEDIEGYLEKSKIKPIDKYL